MLPFQYAYQSLIYPYFFIHSILYSLGWQGERIYWNVHGFHLRMFIYARPPLHRSITSIALLLSVLLLPREINDNKEVKELIPWTSLPLSTILCDFWGIGSNKILNIYIERCIQFPNSRMYFFLKNNRIIPCFIIYTM